MFSGYLIGFIQSFLPALWTAECELVRFQKAVDWSGSGVNPGPSDCSVFPCWPLRRFCELCSAWLLLSAYVICSPEHLCHYDAAETWVLTTCRPYCHLVTLLRLSTTGKCVQKHTKRPFLSVFPTTMPSQRPTPTHFQMSLCTSYMQFKH